jgi:Domain of unknown function (DUF5134)
MEMSGGMGDMGPGAPTMHAGSMGSMGGSMLTMLPGGVVTGALLLAAFLLAALGHLAFCVRSRSGRPQHLRSHHAGHALMAVAMVFMLLPLRWGEDAALVWQGIFGTFALWSVVSLMDSLLAGHRRGRLHALDLVLGAVAMVYMFGLAGGPLSITGALRSLLTAMLIGLFAVYGVVFSALAAMYVAGHVAHLRGIPPFSARVGFSRACSTVMGVGMSCMFFAMR